MPNSRVFLDIDLDSWREKYERAAAFVEATDLRYGFSSKDITELGGGEKQRIKECYADDFDWSGKGPIEVRLHSLPAVRLVAWYLRTYWVSSSGVFDHAPYQGCHSRVSDWLVTGPGKIRGDVF
jgi:hypothetical protein